MGKRVTLATIAATLGVSRTTVSNAYNRPDQLSAEMRHRILATARELGYAGPDPTASVLRRGRAGAIGLIEKSLRDALTDPASLEMMAGVARACDEANVGLVLVPQRLPSPGTVAADRETAPSGDATGDVAGDRTASADDELAVVSTDVVRTAVVDGFVAHCDAIDDARRAIVSDRGLPLVILDGRAEDDEVSVGVDDDGGAAAVARHLLDLGHRRFAIVSFSVGQNGRPSAVSERRLAGYLGALGAAGIPADDVVVVPGGHYDPAFTTTAVAHLWALEPRPTAVMAMSDVFAAAVVRSAIAAGLHVPDDVSVTGFDDAPAARTSQPPITTVRQPHAEKGAAAVRYLLDGAPPGTRLVLPVELVVRESTAPPTR